MEIVISYHNNEINNDYGNDNYNNSDNDKMTMIK